MNSDLNGITHVTNIKINKLEKRNYIQKIGMYSKPRGLWLAFNNEWLTKNYYYPPKYKNKSYIYKIELKKELITTNL